MKTALTSLLLLAVLLATTVAVAAETRQPHTRSEPPQYTVTAPASAPDRFIVHSGNDLVPTGVTFDKPFRILFLTSAKRNAVPTDIETYNTFVQNSAASGRDVIQPYAAHFQAVASTEDIDARDNTGMTSSGEVIYWLNGAKAADSYADFHDGSWDNEVHPRNENGNTISAGGENHRPWTGSKDNATEYIADGVSHALGTDMPRAGHINHATANPLSWTNRANTVQQPLLAISPRFIPVRGIGNITDETTARRNNRNLGNPDSDREEYLMFTLDAERLISVRAEGQETPHAVLEIVDETAHTVFKGNGSGSRGTGSDAVHHDTLSPTVIGPGTWAVKMSQTVATDNIFDVIVNIDDAPVIPGDDYAAGIWTDGTVPVGSSISPGYSTDGSITSPSNSVRDYDWLKVVIPATGKYEIRAVPRGNNGTRPLILLRDRYGQASSELFDSEGHLRRKIDAGTYFVELRGSNGDYSLGIRTGWTPPGSEPFMGDLKGDTLTKGWVMPNRWAPSGNMHISTDRDYFKVQLAAGKKYRFKMQGADSGKGTLYDPYVLLISNTGFPLPLTTDKVDLITGDHTGGIGDTDSGKGREATLEILVNEGGTYYILANDWAGNTGTYRLKVVTFE